MRSNLLSLQNISKQVSSTQNNLATGKKVNSAIDNPSSYYTAASLNNRAKDLDALLDSMGQAVSAIKAATTALEAGADFLEQAAAVATQALETASVPAKSFFEDKAGANGAVVTTAQELKDAVAAGKETIVVYGKIDYFENENITLKPGQKLVGTEYFTGYTGKAKFSELNFKSNVSGSAVNLADNTLVSDLKINYNNSLDENIYALRLDGNKATINNIDVKLTTSGTTKGKAAILSYDGAVLNIKGNNNIQTSGNFVYGIYALSNSTANISGKTNISTDGQNSYGIYTGQNSVTNITAEINIQTKGANAYGIITSQNAVSNLNGRISVKTSGQVAHGIVSLGGVNNIGNQINIQTNGSASYGILNGSSGEGTTNILSSARIHIETGGWYLINYPLPSGKTANTLLIEQGAQIALKNSTTGQESYFDTIAEYKNINESTTAVYLSPSNMAADSAHFAATTGSWEPQETIDWSIFAAAEQSSESAEYNQILSQYNNLIKDASYKGTNLLQNERLNVKFNEDGASALNVSGKDMSTGALGLATTDWQTQGDIAQSLSEISAALKNIRSFSAELGNNYSIITNRQSFTENLMNLLTEGADKLTLADINEESAQILALQTRQQLAINSLSLASKASRAVLKLF